MISATRMSATARAATLRSKATYSSAVTTQQLLNRAYSSQSLGSRNSALLQTNRLVSQLVSPYTTLPLTRSFHVSTTFWQEQQKQQQKEEKEGEKKEEGKEEKEKGEESKEGEGEEKGEEKKDAPPPPPHGDKSPWQVFTETLQSEFKASKEWNESTKALASSAHQISENENVKRARAAYEAAQGAATSRTSTAFKTTGQAIGKSAAWTWDTSVVKGFRKGVTATGTGIEKATRPVRETDAYKTAVGGVKDAIDDGSSSRYGGWTEKEERRKQRQLREEMASQTGRKSGPIVEDPK